MTKYSKMMAGFFIIMLAFLANAQLTRTITVTGTIQDSASGLPLAGALVMLLDTNTIPADIPGFIANIGNLKLDSTVSGADGQFSYVMTVSTSNFILGYAVLKQDYQLKFSAAGILSTTVNLGIIKIAKSDAGLKDTLTVMGRVLDFITNVPVPGALVIMSGIGALDTASGNRATTNVDGIFSKQIIITKLNGVSIVGYVVSQLNYATKIGEMQASGKQVDLGAILLSPISQVVLPRRFMHTVENRPDGMCVYSLNGRLLYNGPVMPFEKITLCKGAPVMVMFKSNGILIDRRQVFLSR
jgi:hypothetical protein